MHPLLRLGPEPSNLPVGVAPLASADALHGRTRGMERRKHWHRPEYIRWKNGAEAESVGAITNPVLRSRDGGAEQGRLGAGKRTFNAARNQRAGPNL